MALWLETLRDHMDVIYLLYGLAFVLLGTSMLLLPKEGLSSNFVRSLWLLAGFGLLHGAKEWLDLWIMLRGESALLSTLGTLLLLASFGFLLEFGRRLVRSCGRAGDRSSWAGRLFGPWVYAPLAGCLGLAVGLDPVNGLGIGSRYFLGFPGALLTAVGLLTCARPASRDTEPRMLAAPFRLAALAFAVYAIVGGLIAPAGEVLSRHINEASFLSTVGVPVQVLRATCAALILGAVASILRLLHAEVKQRLRHALDTAQSSLVKVGRLSARNQLILEAAGRSLCGLDHRGRITFVNSLAAGSLGWAPDELIGRPHDEVLHGLPAGEGPCRPGRCPIQASLCDGRTRKTEDDMFRRKDGSSFRAAYTSTPVHEAGRVVGAVVSFKDVTEIREIEKHLQEAALVLEHMPEGVMITDARGRIQSVNPAFQANTGYRRDELVGRNLMLLRSGHHPASFYREIWDALQMGGQWQGEIWIRRKNREIHPEWLSINALRDPDGRVTNYVALCSDVNTHREVRQRLHHLAYYDGLTGLPNRQLFQDRLDLALAQARRAGEMTAVMFLDLDRFKHVNDSLGHSVGDRILRAIAKRLMTAVRESDTIARIGGDEFTVILPGLSSPRAATLVARKILRALEQPLRLDGREFYITASIGISVFPDDGVDRETLTKRADIAMYRAKDLGRNNYQSYRADMSARFQQRLVLEHELRRALERSELYMLYQPQVDIGSGRIVGVEALARWRHPRLADVPPSTFIPIAEEAGLIDRIGEWSLRTACEEAQQWEDERGGKLRLAVNLSASQLRQPDFAQRVEHVLRQSGMDADRLTLELTEGVLMENFSAQRTALGALSEMGVHIAIDDFGTGYSSLSYIKRFAIDVLKIDQSFVRELPHEPSDRTLAAMIIAVAHASGIRVTAEGVENRQQLEFLHRQGCDEGQGFLFSRPLPAAGIRRLVRRTNAPGSALARRRFTSAC